mmetsp:Transcript_100/g.226  ORF Transcript_100/g.226 Transcript_100/m.226 type:complete len:99 (-) Transcript_100:603-899(-)
MLKRMNVHWIHRVPKLSGSGLAEGNAEAREITENGRTDRSGGPSAKAAIPKKVNWKVSNSTPTMTKMSDVTRMSPGTYTKILPLRKPSGRMMLQSRSF